jgi:hypothetical protein
VILTGKMLKRRNEELKQRNKILSDLKVKFEQGIHDFQSFNRIDAEFVSMPCQTKAVLKQ